MKNNILFPYDYLDFQSRDIDHVKKAEKIRNLNMKKLEKINPGMLVTVWDYDDETPSKVIVLETNIRGITCLIREEIRLFQIENVFLDGEDPSRAFMPWDKFVAHVAKSSSAHHMSTQMVAIANNLMTKSQNIFIKMRKNDGTKK